MGFKKSIVVAIGTIMMTGSVGLMLPSPAYAGSEKKISLKRSNPNEPIGRDAVLSHVKAKFSGRVLSVQEKPTAKYPDCHIVRMLSVDGEYLTIKVACND